MDKLNFLNYKCIFNSLNTINYKFFHNHGEIYGFRRKFKKESGDIKPLGVHRNMKVDNGQNVCLLFC